MISLGGLLLLSKEKHSAHLNIVLLYPSKNFVVQHVNVKKEIYAYLVLLTKAPRKRTAGHIWPAGHGLRTAALVRF